MARQLRWSELTPGQRFGILTLASVELALTATAMTDLVRRPRDLVRGPKLVWGLGFLVQPVGPPAYLLLGRRPAEAVAG